MNQLLASEYETSKLCEKIALLEQTIHNADLAQLKRLKKERASRFAHDNQLRSQAIFDLKNLYAEMSDTNYLVQMGTIYSDRDGCWISSVEQPCKAWNSFVTAADAGNLEAISHSHQVCARGIQEWQIASGLHTRYSIYLVS